MPDLEALTSAVTLTRVGIGSVTTVQAPANGLVEAVAREARASGALFLSAAGSERAQTSAHGVSRQLFGRVVSELPDEEREALLAGPARTAVELLDGAPADDDHAVGQGVLWVAVELAARRPFVLVVDDAQWADRQSLAVLARLGRRTPRIALALILAVRHGELAGAAPELRELVSP